ncbi:MAG: hypothetical protein QT11_C0001G1019 [archaeon GW2011_AR20]|nr:MAG: hypothetical protein QT11_C0001G1019 [archaeon GW2011_AR20]AQS33424.1 hypothetical protein [uncultured archaeon]AQS33512.1 hypothetical protein [uncultured archaeon]MBS3161011.1 hypothetical protein [Candidatus Woesearchaeota archaeon]
MATIMSSKNTGNGKIMLEVASDYDEFLQLRGHLDDIHLFTEKVAEVKTNISQRGKNEATKYFLIPREFRRGFKFNNTTSCQRIDLGNKVVFLYVIDKLKINPSRRELALKKIEGDYGSHQGSN